MKHMHLNSSGNARTCKWDQPRITNTAEGADIHIKKQKNKNKREKRGQRELEIV
jgi:hypothetical protein